MTSKPPTLCGLCNTNPSKYKCPTCVVPYCSLACYKPHKLQHAAEPKATSSTPSTLTVEEPASKPHKFASVLQSPEITSMLQSKTLQKHLRDVYKASLKPNEEEQQRRHQEWQRRMGTRGRGRGRGRGRAGRFNSTGVPPTWTQEKGDRAALNWLGRLRSGGSHQNIEVEEFIERVVATLDQD